MIPSDLVDLSRLQFAVTAMYHFIFVPLTLGLSFMLVAMEVTYVLTGKEIYKDMTRFWGKLFGINFALGVATGITMEFQFGTNWAYYSHYVGDIFGAPLAIEGLMAFFLESTFIGLFFFGWDRLSKGKHLAATILMAVGSNLSALWILVANAWMMNPVGAEFNFQTMRMEMVDFWAVLTNEWAQAKFVHTVAGGYMTGAIFVMAISAYYMLRRQDLQFARSSFRLAAVFGMIATLMTIQMGDESGYLVTKDQPTKIAAMEAIWETHEAPAPLTLFASPDEAAQTNHAQIDVPWLFGLMGTRSLSTEIPGIKELTAQAEQRIVNGTVAENGNGNAWRFIAAYDLHTVIHGLGYPAAVDREAEECERIMVDCRVHARSGQLLHGSVTQLLADDVRDGFCSAAGAEVKNRVFHCLFPFLFLLPLYVQINPPVCNMCALHAFRQRHSCRTLPVKPRYCRRGSYSQAVRLFFRRSGTY